MKYSHWIKHLRATAYIYPFHWTTDLQSTVLYLDSSMAYCSHTVTYTCRVYQLILYDSAGLWYDCFTVPSMKWISSVHLVARPTAILIHYVHAQNGACCMQWLPHLHIYVPPFGHCAVFSLKRGRAAPHRAIYRRWKWAGPKSSLVPASNCISSRLHSALHSSAGSVQYKYTTTNT